MLVIVASNRPGRGCAAPSRVRILRFVTPVTAPPVIHWRKTDSFKKTKSAGRAIVGRVRKRGFPVSVTRIAIVSRNVEVSEESVTSKRRRRAYRGLGF